MELIVLSLLIFEKKLKRRLICVIIWNENSLVSFFIVDNDINFYVNVFLLI